MPSSPSQPSAQQALPPSLPLPPPSRSTRRSSAAALAFVLLALGGMLPAAALEPSVPLAYPPARRGIEVDELHSRKVPDPYRWMEEMGSTDTRTWAREQDELARRSLHSLPGFESLEARLREVNRFDTLSSPVPRGGRIFFTRRQADEQQAALMVQDGPDAEPRPLVDANRYPGKALLGFVPGPEGKLVAYGLAPVGSGWGEWRVREVATGKDLPDRLLGLRYSAPVWHPSGREMLYVAYAVPARGEELQTVLGAPRVHRHRLGTTGPDPVIFERPQHPEWTYSLGVTEGGDDLVLTIAEGSATEARVVLLGLARDGAYPQGSEPKLVPLVAEPVASYSFLGDLPSSGGGTRLFFRTDRDAPGFRVVAVDLGPEGPGAWREIVPPSSEVLSLASLVANRLIGLYLKDAVPEVRVFDLDGRLERRFELPQRGTTFSGFAGRRTDPAAYFTVNSVALPSTPYQLDPASGALRRVAQPRSAFDPDDYVLEQVFYRGHDGTRIPMFLAYKKGIDPKSDRPTMMYGYGAYSWPAFPWFQPHVLVWMELGGLYALPGIRGGGEYGEPWHRAGSGRQKRTSIHDFVRAAEHLIAEGYTSPSKLAIRGGSASGMLAGAALVERPELFAASLINIPVLDLIRGHRLTSGAYRFAEFGTPDDAADLEVLLSYSPYHNIRPGTCYPPTLLFAGERDETAPPVHAYKFAAALQHAQSQTAAEAPCASPVLLRMAWGAGHSIAALPEDRPEAWASQLAFLAWHTGLPLGGVSPGPRGEAPGKPARR